jgi:hypothetical protein
MFSLRRSMAEGKNPAPDTNNPVYKRRVDLDRKVKSIAEQTGQPIEEIALELVKQNLPDVQRYVISKGEAPLSNPVELSLQAFLLRQQEIRDLVNTTGASPEAAEVYLTEIEAGSKAPDNFIGSIIGAIGAVAGKGVQAMQASRKKKGKPTKFWDTLSEIFKPGDSDIDLTKGVGVAAKDVLDDIANRERKAQIQKMLPLIILGVIAIIVITIIATKKK